MVLQLSLLWMLFVGQNKLVFLRRCSSQQRKPAPYSLLMGLSQTFWVRYYPGLPFLVNMALALDNYLPEHRHVTFASRIPSNCVGVSCCTLGNSKQLEIDGYV